MFDKGKYYFNIPVTIVLFTILMYLVFLKSGLSPIILVAGILCIILLLISQSDIRSKLIPNLYILLLLVPVVMDMLFVRSVSNMERLIGFVFIALPLVIVKMIKPNGIGGGDVKMLAVGGLLLGFGAITALLIGSILGGSVNLFLLAIGRAKKGQRCWVGPYYAIGIWYSYVYILH